MAGPLYTLLKAAQGAVKQKDCNSRNTKRRNRGLPLQKMITCFEVGCYRMISGLLWWIGSSCTVHTDNNLLTYVLSSAKLNATGCRWEAKLVDFHLTIRYCLGRENCDADGLSRMPCDIKAMLEKCSELFPFEDRPKVYFHS